MRIEDILYFSPNIRETKLKDLSDDEILCAYKERIIAWYIDPSSDLNKQKSGFSSGLILLSLIDALARYFIPENGVVERRYKEFLTKYFEMDKKSAKAIYDNFRNGLVHESRLKKRCYFDYGIGELFYQENNRLIINPDIMNEKIRNLIEELFHRQVYPSATHEVVKRIKEDFQYALKDDR